MQNYSFRRRRVRRDKNGKETLITIETKKPKEISKVIDGVYPIELSQGKMGKLIINDIKTENNKTIVKYIAKGRHLTSKEKIFL
nr:hypothetical protein [Clostridium sporogenes]